MEVRYLREGERDRLFYRLEGEIISSLCASDRIEPGVAREPGRAGDPDEAGLWGVESEAAVGVREPDHPAVRDQDPRQGFAGARSDVSSGLTGRLGHRRRLAGPG